MPPPSRPHRLIVRCPNPVGDLVMSTPALRALREGWPEAEITLLAPPAAEDVFAGAPWYDRFLALPARTEGRRKTAGLLRFAKALRTGRFDTGLLLTNSFSSAFLFWVARLPRRIGYARDGRSWLLTDPVPVPRPDPEEEEALTREVDANAAHGPQTARATQARAVRPPVPARELPPPRGWTRGRLEALRRPLRHPPAPMVDYYLSLLNAIGIDSRSHRLSLGIPDAVQAGADQMLLDQGCDWRKHRLVLMAPGAGFGTSKLWTNANFARVADAVSERYQSRVGIFGGPGEEIIVRGIVRESRRMHAALIGPLASLALLKAYCRRASLFIGTDSGARHFATAFEVPCVVLFGPTDPRWSAGDLRRTVLVREPVACAPCHLKSCPIDHRCMESITPDRVLDAVERVMGS